MLNSINQLFLNFAAVSTDGMTMADKMLDGLLYTVIGMGITFAVLIVIAFVIWSLKFVNRPAKKENNSAENTIEVPEQKQVNNKVIQETMHSSDDNTDENLVDDTELVAVIMSAIAASLNTSTDNLYVRSIRRSRAKNY